MRKLSTRLWTYSAALLLLGAAYCGRKEPSRTAVASDTTAWLTFEPQIVEIAGTVQKIAYWGAPNFGEDTVGDKREYAFIIALDRSVNVRGDSTDELNQKTKMNISEIQIVWPGQWSNYLGKHVHARGKLFTAFSGHHVRDVLMNADSLWEDAGRNNITPR